MHIIKPQLTKLKVVLLVRVLAYLLVIDKRVCGRSKRDISININNSILVGLRFKLAMIKDKM